MPVTADDLLALLARRRRPESLRDLLAPLRLGRGERQAAQRLLEELVARGRVQRRRDGRLFLPRSAPGASGRISVHREGYGFVTPDQGGDDIFVPARFRGGAMDGDRVALQAVRSGRGGGREGEVAQVLERAHVEVVGRLEGDDRYASVIPADPRLQERILVAPADRGAARAGEMVLVRIDRFPERQLPAAGTVVRVFGHPDDPEVEMRVLAFRHGLPCDFPEDALAEAEALPEGVAEEELAGRVDLRDLPLVTIDGETARDFDDAVAVRTEGSQWRLWVAIADVGHYVTEGSALDRAALERGTSVYFPDRCLPMLPERLSNGLCSLNPGVDRLVLVAELLFDRQGTRLQERFYPAVMRSRARLTYTEVAHWLQQPETAAQELDPRPEVAAMRDLALVLQGMRRVRGSIDFDLSEAEVVLDEKGRPLQVGRRERTPAHRLIEEFMLAANEAVAAFLEGQPAPLLFRIHEPPDWDKLLAFQALVAHFGYGLALGHGTVDPHELQRLLQAAAGKPEERLFNQMLLRSMQQARYAAENLGHFGLAATSYCHFTSPIRRYPDLLVHRVLRRVLAGRLGDKLRARLQQELPALGAQLSGSERRAMEAEREMLELKRCQFLADKVGMEFSGVVTGLQPFGLFVELLDPFVEGLVPVASLSDDYYEFDSDRYRLIGQRRRRIFRIGDELQVVVRRVDLERRQIELVPAEFAREESPETNPRLPRRSPRGRR